MRRGGFTITELFVVIAITAIIITIAVPAFVRLQQSNARAQSENAVLVATRVARDIAVRDGVDTAAVFFQDVEPDGDPLTRVVVTALVGTFEDLEEAVDPFDDALVDRARSGGVLPVVERELFVPVDGAVVQELAPGWSVRGWMVPFASQAPGDEVRPLDRRRIWYDGETYGAEGTTPEDAFAGAGGAVEDFAFARGQWVAPETDYFDVSLPGGHWTGGNAPNDLRTPRSTFMVRFEGGTGRLVRSFVPALVLDPRPAIRVQAGVGGSDGEAEYDIDPDPARVDDQWWKVERASSLRRWAQRVIAARASALWGSDPTDPREAEEIARLRSQLIGLYSNDTVVTGPVNRLAVYRESELAAATGLGLADGTGTVYAAPEPGSTRIAFDLSAAGPPVPTGDPANRPEVAAAIDASTARELINQWVEGDTNFNLELFFRGERDVDDEPRAVLFTVEQITGELLEVER